MTTPNYDDILDTLDRQAIKLQDLPGNIAQQCEDARLLREAMEIVRERRDQGEGERPPQEIDCSMKPTGDTV